MPKIIHCADVHLDAPFTLSNAEQSEKRRTELRSTFTSLVMYAKTVGTELFLISGDLFDDTYITKDTAELLYREFSSFPDCHFFITPGNHDYFHERSPYRILKWPSNVHIFTDCGVNYFEITEKNTRVYGYAFTSGTMTHNPYANFIVPENGMVNLLLAHGDIDSPFSPYCPIMKSDLEKSGFDYIALGHIHEASGILTAGNSTYAYSGCLEGRGFDELGYKGAVAGTVDLGKVALKGVRFSKKRYEKATVDLTGTVSAEDAYEKIADVCSTFTDDTALRIILNGIVSPDFSVDKTTLRTKLPKPFYLELKDETLPILDFEYLKKDETLLGTYFRKLEPYFHSESTEERKRAALALKYGLCAMNGKEIGL
jgi:DNA repair exonuclease